jgi:dihydroflavonol-4-reductase
LTRQLLADGHRVRILRRASSKMDALEGLLDYIEQVIGDLDDLPLLSEALSGVDWVFHVAAVAEYWRVGVEQIYRVNVGGTRTLLEAAQRAGVSVSSSPVARRLSAIWAGGAWRMKIRLTTSRVTSRLMV